MNEIVRTILKPFASLRLTVVLLALSIVLVFAGTWAQIDHDVWTVQKRYFHSFFTWIHFQLFLPREQLPAASAWKPLVAFFRPLGFPMLGGYSLIALLLANLVAAHTVRFKLTRGRIGIILIHAGLILLILGEVIASVWQVEGQMRLSEAQTAGYTEDIRQVELAVIDPSPTDHDNVTVIPASRLVKQGTISYPTLPFEIHVDQYFPNSVVLGPFQARQMKLEPNSPATAGAGVGLTVVEQPRVTGAGPDANRVDAPSAYVTLTRNGRNLGTYLVSRFLESPQDVEIDGNTYRLILRWKRAYKPYAITLLDFTHDKYTGTDTPRNFSSRVRLVDPTRSEDREVLIWMNHPLRYAGETFYQSGFDGPTTTILQVVRNPGWLIPYISCTMVALGMIVHFGALLVGFLRRPLPGGIAAPSRSKKRAGPGPQQYVLNPRGGIALPLIVTTACVLYLLAAGRPPKLTTPYDFNTFSRVPISYEGRVMPMDTLAQVSLRVISGKSSLLDAGQRRPAIQWLADVFARPDRDKDYRVFRIDHPDLKSVLELDPDQKLFSLDEVFKRGDKLDGQYRLAASIPAKSRNLYQKAVHDLGQHVFLHNRLAGVETLFLAPPLRPGEDWRMFGEAQSESKSGGENPGIRAFRTLAQSYHNERPDVFNATAQDYVAYFHTLLPGESRRVTAEMIFNWFQPFYHCMVLYVLVFLLICGSWLISPWRATLQRTALWVLMLTLGFHSLALLVRIYIQGRPVTNLYSSAIFIGWAAVVACAVLERIFRNGLGSLAAALIAFPSLLIAHFLAGSGDTMQMVQAVLDTNFWLWTHVPAVTIGYAATFLAGMIGTIYVIGGVFTRALDADARKTISRMVYGVVCFAMLFSFVGTILGGIWADQSWGRFWGWDPKENGAVLIVLWNAIILHARWGGVIRERGVMLLAIFGNVVTAWSWFGTNMLGIGLHSYGFMDSAVFWMGLFIATQLFLIGLGNLPLSRGRSVSAG